MSRDGGQPVPFMPGLKRQGIPIKQGKKPYLSPKPASFSMVIGKPNELGKAGMKSGLKP